MRLPLMIAGLALMCALLSGCGIAFGDAPAANDFFTTLEVTGDKTTGAPLTAAIAYETFYPAPVEILCELRRGSETLRVIGRGQAPAIAPERTPDDDGVPGNFSADFTVDEAGAYKIECYTPADDANYIVEEFSVGQAPIE